MSCGLDVRILASLRELLDSGQVDRHAATVYITGHSLGARAGHVQLRLRQCLLRAGDHCMGRAESVLESRILRIRGTIG